jgi:hypothetical protein
MWCDEFIQGYSDYRDGLLSDGTRARFDRHVRLCDRCARYDSVVDRGVGLWCGLPGAEASPDFLPRLQHRLYHVDDAARLTSKRALGSAALVAVASVGLLAVTWLPFATRMTVEVELPPVAVKAPVSVMAGRQPSLFDEGPYVSPPRRFFVPLYATLDEPTDLFTTYSLPVRMSSDGGIVRTGQLDESR